MATREILTKAFAALACLLVVLQCSGCVTYFGYDGPYEGRIIDGDTRKPIEGAVVHGTWVKSHPGPGGASSSFYDAKEALTDKNGNFRISGMGILVFSNMEEMELNVLKAGYTQLHGYWTGLKNKELIDEIEWEDSKAVIKLRRMTLEERKERVIYSPGLSAKKERLFRLEENRENIEIGAPEESIHKVE